MLLLRVGGFWMVTTSNLPVAFGSIFGIQLLPNVSAKAQAVHRPRDIALAMDLSGSMRFGTCLGFDSWTIRGPRTTRTQSIRSSAHTHRAAPACKGQAPIRPRR